MKKAGFINTNWATWQNLKRDVLYFDEIHIDEWIYKEFISDVINLYPFLPYEETQLLNANEIDTTMEYLHNNGIVKLFNRVDMFTNYLLNIDKENKNEKEIGNIGKHLIDFAEKKTEYENQPEINNFSSLTKNLELFDNLSANMARLGTIFFNQLEAQKSGVPIINENIRTNFLGEKKTEVLKIVLEKFPVPDGSVSWEQIIDFKKDEDSQQKLLRLNSWINKVAHSKLDEKEIHEEIEHLMIEYENRMKLHNMKFNFGTIEILTVTTIGVLENLVKFNWSKVSKILFDFKKRHYDILLGETKAPGRELAYINKAKKKFKEK